MELFNVDVSEMGVIFSRGGDGVFCFAEYGLDDVDMEDDFQIRGGAEPRFVSPPMPLTESQLFPMPEFIKISNRIKDVLRDAAKRKQAA